MIRFHAFDDVAQAAQAQADAVAGWLRADLAARAASVVLALSGGRSPIPFFERLSQAELDWARVELRLVDERMIDPAHPHSNERLLREHVWRHRARAARLVGLAGAGDSETAAVQRANRWRAPIDLAVLGMGTDGHTASLFARAPEYAAATDPDAAERYCLVHPTADAADPPLARISLTLAALLGARRLLLALSGGVKREVFERARRAPDAALPISLLLAHAQSSCSSSSSSSTGVDLDVYWHP